MPKPTPNVLTKFMKEREKTGSYQQLSIFAHYEPSLATQARKKVGLWIVRMLHDIYQFTVMSGEASEQTVFTPCVTAALYENRRVSGVAQGGGWSG